MKQLIKLFIKKYPLGELVLAYNLALLFLLLLETYLKSLYLLIVPSLILIYGCYCWYKLKDFFEKKRESFAVTNEDKHNVDKEQWLLNSSHVEIKESNSRIRQLLGFYLVPPVSTILSAALFYMPH